MASSDLESLSEIFNDTKHRAVSLRQLSFLSANIFVPQMSHDPAAAAAVYGDVQLNYLDSLYVAEHPNNDCIDYIYEYIVTVLMNAEAQFVPKHSKNFKFGGMKSWTY